MSALLEILALIDGKSVPFTITCERKVVVVTAARRVRKGCGGERPVCGSAALIALRKDLVLQTIFPPGNDETSILTGLWWREAVSANKTANKTPNNCSTRSAGKLSARFRQCHCPRPVNKALGEPAVTVKRKPSVSK
jgi:hypothetical protein